MSSGQSECLPVAVEMMGTLLERYLRIRIKDFVNSHILWLTDFTSWNVWGDSSLALIKSSKCESIYYRIAYDNWQFWNNLKERNRLSMPYTSFEETWDSDTPTCIMLTVKTLHYSKWLFLWCWEKIIAYEIAWVCKEMSAY